MNPFFKYLVREARKRNVSVIDRCNLTIFFEGGHEDLPSFLTENKVYIVASLSCYEKANVDEQRGKGTFDKSIQALQILNSLGYGAEDGKLILNLVYTPLGPYLAGEQQKLEAVYKARLSRDFDICFNSLFTITNMPITRYEKYLKAKCEYDDYLSLLRANFNFGTIENLMCRDTLSIGWDGTLYDCDFNQALELQMVSGKTALNILDIDRVC